MPDNQIWIKEIKNLIEKGLSDDEIAQRVPFRSRFVKLQRDKLFKKECDPLSR